MVKLILINNSMNKYFVSLIVGGLILMGAGCSEGAVTEWQDKASDAASSVQDWYAEVEENMSDDAAEEQGELQQTLAQEGVLVSGQGFSLTVPDGWMATGRDEVMKHSDGRVSYGWIESGVSEGPYGDPDLISITIQSIEKDEKTYAEIVDMFGWDESDIDEHVDFMKENAHPPYNEITGEDIIVTSRKVVVGDSEANYSEMRCEKICFIEGIAKTMGKYFIEDGDQVYILEIGIGTNEFTDERLSEAEKVIKTFIIE
jgi:hypothetical protein